MRPGLKFLGITIIVIFVFAGCSRHENKTVEQLNKETIQLLKEQKIPKAFETAQKALNLSRKKYGDEDLHTAECLKNMAIVYQSKKEFNLAEAFYKKALAILGKHGKGNGSDAAQIFNNLAAFAYLRGDYDQAADFYKRCLAIAKKVFPAGDKRVSVIEANLKRCAEDSVAKGSKDKKKSGFNNEPVANAGSIPDFVPEKIKKYVVTKLAGQSIYLSDFHPRPLLKIGDKGVIFPYTCIKKDKKNGEGIKAMILFAAVHDKKEETKYIFKQTRLVSYEAYMAQLSEGGIPMLKKEMAKLFPRIFL